MTDLTSIINGAEETITSREIAELTGKRHDHVMRDVKKLNEYYNENSRPQVSVGVYKDANNQDRPQFLLNKRQSLDLCMGYSLALRIAVTDRWEVLEVTVQSDYIKDEARKLIREEAREGAKPMTDAVKNIREELGKETKAYHYATEHNMIDVLVLGMTAKKFCEVRDIDRSKLRDHLTKIEIDLINTLQTHNTVLLDIGMDYQDRKTQLQKIYLVKSGRLALDK